MSEKQSYDVVLEADFHDPALAAAAFQLLREAAKLHDLPNIGWTRVHLEVDFDGHAYPSQIEKLKHHLDALWFGGVASVKVTPKMAPAEQLVE